MDDDADVRQCDPTYYDTLIQGGENNAIVSDAEMNNIMMISKREQEIKDEMQLQQIIEISSGDYAEKQQLRAKQFQTIERIIIKLNSVDKANSKTYELILSIITLYRECIIDTYNLDDNYEKVLNILSSIRISKEELNEFKNIICTNI